MSEKLYNAGQTVGSRRYFPFLLFPNWFMTITAFTSALLPAKQSLLPDDTPTLPARHKQLSENQQRVAKSSVLLDLSSVSPSCCVISGKRFDPPEVQFSLLVQRITARINCVACDGPDSQCLIDGAV